MKSRQWVAGLATIACFGLATAADAVVNIQNTGAGARSMAMGNSFVAVADDGDAVFANPAGVGLIENREVTYTNVSLLYSGIDGDNLGQHVISYVQPLGGMGLGLGFERIGSGLMSENGAFLSLAMGLGKNLNLGVNAKYLFWSVDDIPPDNGVADPLSGASAGALGIDLGVLWQSPVQGAKVGVMLKNLNQPNVAKGSVPGDSDAGKLPMDLHLGVGYQVNPKSLVSVQWVVRDMTAESVDVPTGELNDDGSAKTSSESSRTTKLVVGGETRVVQDLMLRAGGSRFFEDDASGELNGGLGYSWSENMSFDYSYHIPLDLVETNGAHRFTLGYQF
jgi:hypothetical protein